MRWRISALLWIAVSLAPAASASELIVNGGFEGQLEPWRFGGEWVAAPGQALTGGACVAGEVAGPDLHHVLAQTVSLRADALYRLTFWIRSSNRNKVEFRLARGATRTLLADYPRIGPGWERHSRVFSVEVEGEYELQLIVPTSFGAPSGKAWVDDVSLVETIELPAQAITTSGIHDAPALAADRQGRLYMGWIESDGATDRLRLAIGKVSADRLVITGEFNHEIAADAFESVTLAATERGAWGCASAETDAGFDIHCFRIGPRGLSEGAFVTHDAAVDIRPALAIDGEGAWVVWESNRDGSRQIWARALPLDDGHPARRISIGEESNGFPTAAGDGAGRVWAVWSRAVEGQYDLYVAVHDAAGWSEATALTRNPYIETRPHVAWAAGGLWVAWEVSTHPGLRTSYSDMRRVLVARLGQDGLEAPRNAWDALPEWSSSPRLLAWGERDVALTLRTSQWQRGNWNAELFTLGPKGFTARGPLGVAFGRNRAAPMAYAGDRLWAAVQTDNVDGRWNDAQASGSVESRIQVASAASSATRQAVLLEPLVLPRTSFDPQAQRVTLGEERPRATLEHGGEKLQLYWGQFHEHSEISFDSRRVDLPPDENYMVNRDYHRMDFAALTDHDFNMSPHIWSYLGKLARWQHDPGRFVTFLAQEWTSSHDVVTQAHPHGYYGHRNLILADPRATRWFNAREGAAPADVWASLRGSGSEFISIPHQLADTGNVPIDWDWLDEEAQPLAEIYQLRGSYEHRGAPREAQNTVDGYFLRDAWNDGVIIGVIASSDHGGGLGKAAVWAPELTREAILDASRKRHTYGTTGPRIVLDFRVNGALMGEKLPLDGRPARISVRASGPAPIDRVEIFRNGEAIYDRQNQGAEVSADLTDRRIPVNGDYYYVRLRSGSHLAWSSPVWFLADPLQIQRREGFREPVSKQGSTPGPENHE